MIRKITVKGTGYASVKPDLIVITLDLKTKFYTYEETMKQASNASQELLNVILRLGFEEEDLKTTAFFVNTIYNSYRDEQDNYQKRFAGYQCQHNLRLEFALDLERLSQVLTALTQSPVDPVFDIQFTVKDSSSVSEDLLRSAAKNAKDKATILTDASGVQLGEIVDINYNWERIDLYSSTDFRMMEAASDMSEMSPHIVPEEIDVSDTVTFIWEIH